MSARLNALELAEKVVDYLLNSRPVCQIENAHWCMDKRVFDDPEAIFYPDDENRFPSCIRAMEYILEEGLPVWLVTDDSNYPLEVFTYRKLELLFNI